AGQGHQARPAQGRNGEYKAVEEGRHAPPAGEEIVGIARRRQQADRRAKHDWTGEHEKPDPDVRHAPRLRHERHRHQRRGPRGKDPEVGAEPRIDQPDARCDRHVSSDALQMSSCAPCQWSIASWRLTNTATVTKAMIRRPWQARKYPSGMPKMRMSL